MKNDVASPRAARAAGLIGSLGPDEPALGIAWKEGPGVVQSLWHRQGDDPVSEEPRFVVYSITKMMIGTIALALQEVGRLHVDAPLADFRSDLPNASGISLRQILTHTAGFPDYGRLESYRRELAEHPERPWDRTRFAAETWQRGMLFEPGEAWSYSNPGYMLIVEVLEEVTEMSFRELVDYWIVEPLGLQQTGVVETIDDLRDLAPAPSSALSSDGTPRDIRRCYHPGWVSHRLVASTPSDVVRYTDALAAGRIVTAHTLEEMTRPVPVPDDSPRWGEPGYGLGLMIDPSAAWGSFLGHGGAGPGTTTFVAHFPEEDLTFCVMVAGEGREAEEVIEEMRGSN